MPRHNQVNNPSGNNGYSKIEYPPDDVLRAALQEYARENSGSGLSAQDQIARLKQKFGFSIGRTTFFALKNRLGIKTVRKSKLTAIEQAQAIIDIKADDPAGLWGVSQTKARAALAGSLIPRDRIRTILHDHFDEEFARRFIGFQRNGILRVPLDALGPWYKNHFDGHEKLNAQALQMGELSFGIYGGKDSYSSNFMRGAVMPNVRNAEAIGHFFLDLVVEYDYTIPLCLMTDKGGEVGVMADFHRTLRMEAAPEFTLTEWPPIIQTRSVHNTPIEGFWRWKRQGEGHSIKQVLLEGRDTGIFNPNDELHVNVAKWAWSQLIQDRLDTFQEYWNTHKISKQKKKVLPSGKSPRQLFLVPESGRLGARSCAIKVNPATVNMLRESIGGEEGRQAAYRFVDDEFRALADGVYLDLDLPPITLSSIWHTFQVVVGRLRPLFE